MTTCKKHDGPCRSANTAKDGSAGRIAREAREAASRYADINDACPYPFGTEAARLFVEAFHAARAAQPAEPEGPTP